MARDSQWVAGVELAPPASPRRSPRPTAEMSPVEPKPVVELASAETKMTSKANPNEPENAGELASAETEMTSKANLVQPENAGELASAETKMTSEANLVQPENAGELGPVQTQATARDSQWVAGVELAQRPRPRPRRRPRRRRRPKAEIEPVEPEPVVELASEETKMTSQPNLARSERVVEPCKKEENAREDVPPTNGVEVKPASGHRLVVGRRVDWISWMRRRRGLRFSRRKHVRQRTTHTRSQTGSFLPRSADNGQRAPAGKNGIEAGGGRAVSPP